MDSPTPTDPQISSLPPVASYPARFEVDYPQKLDKLTTFFRIFTVIPILVVLGILIGGSTDVQYFGQVVIAGQGIIFMAPLVMILFRQKYPRWWFNWNLEYMRFNFRILSYMYLLRDEYPSTDEEQAVHVDLDYPDAKKLNRWLPLVKWFLAIPHFIILIILFFVVVLFVICAWFSILFTGKYPKVLFDFIVGYCRWSLRVSAYAFLLITDEYPPFKFDA